MILIDASFGESCLAYRLADVLQRAGYSVWPYHSHHFDGKYVLLYAEVSSDRNEIALRGVFESEDISPRHAVAAGGAAKTPSARDVEHLVAKLLASPGFRARVGSFSARESAGQFVTTPIDPAQLAAACALPPPGRR